jgi:hypothetical protein
VKDFWVWVSGFGFEEGIQRLVFRVESLGIRV